MSSHVDAGFHPENASRSHSTRYQAQKADNQNVDKLKKDIVVYERIFGGRGVAVF